MALDKSNSNSGILPVTVTQKQCKHSHQNCKKKRETTYTVGASSHLSDCISGFNQITISFTGTANTTWLAVITQ